MFSSSPMFFTVRKNIATSVTQISRKYSIERQVRSTTSHQSISTSLGGTFRWLEDGFDFSFRILVYSKNPPGWLVTFLLPRLPPENSRQISAESSVGNISNNWKNHGSYLSLSLPTEIKCEKGRKVRLKFHSIRWDVDQTSGLNLTLKVFRVGLLCQINKNIGKRESESSGEEICSPPE